MSDAVMIELIELAMPADTYVNDPFSLTTEDVAKLQAFNALWDRPASSTQH